MALPGELPPVVKVKMTQSPPFADGDGPTGEDLIWVWDISSGVLRKSPISALPFGTGGGGGGTDPVITVPSPFMVFTSSDNYSYDAGTNSVTIRDARLKNRSLYPVMTTQFGGGEFNPELIAYNPIDPDDDTLGNVVISNFQLDEGQHITLIVPGDASASDTTYAQLKADVALLKLVAAPFLTTALGANGGKILWNRPAGEIPAGWQECINMRGKIPIAQDPDDIDFKLAIGTTGGAKDVKLVKENIPQLPLPPAPKLFEDVDRGSNHSKFSIDTVEDAFVGTPDADMLKVKLMNPYRIVMWIEWVGI